MAAPAQHEPTMEEIVVALRETRKRATSPALTVVGNPQPTIAELRDREIERLLEENAQLNRRLMVLLKTIEPEQAHNGDVAALAGAVRDAIEAELRPVMLVLLRLLQRQHVDAPDATHHDGHWIVDLDQENRQ